MGSKTLRSHPGPQPKCRVHFGRPLAFIGPLHTLPIDGLFALSGAMSETDAAKYRKQAEECREQAAKAISPLDSEAWLKVAEEWLKLALSAEGRK